MMHKYILIFYREDGHDRYNEYSWSSSFDLIPCETQNELTSRITQKILEMPDKKCACLVFDKFENIASYYDSYMCGLGENSIYCPQRYYEDFEYSEQLEEEERLEKWQEMLKYEVKIKLGKFSAEAKKVEEERARLARLTAEKIAAEQKEIRERQEYERLKTKYS